MEEERLIVVKITFGDDLRRISLPISQFTFQSLEETVERLFPENQQAVTLKYKDEEGDFITFKSEEETAEALRQLRQNDIFRITVSVPYQSKNEGERKEEDSPSCPWRRRWCRRAARRQRRFSDDEKKKEEGEKKKRGKCGRERRRCGGWKMGAFFRAHREALRLISSPDASDIEEGRKLLLAMLESVPGHIVTTYNLACAESLLGNVKEAVQTLKRAVELGYRNVAHMVADEDFANIREMDEFKAIVSFLRGDNDDDDAEKEQQSEEKEEEEVKEESVEENKKEEEEEEKKEIVIEDVKEEEEKKKDIEHPFARSLAVMKSMGFNNERENIERLIKHRGDLVQAVNELLQGQ